MTNKPFGDKIDWGNEARRVSTEANVFYTVTPEDEFAAKIRKWVPDRRGKNVLDCGCNIGRWSDYLISLGFNYTGIDQSFDALQIARKLRPGYQYIHTFLWDFHCVVPDYDAAVFVAVLQHNTHAEKERIMEMLQAAIKKDGLVFIMESTVKTQTPTQLTHGGWLDLFDRYGFTCVDKWHPNELGLIDRYVFTKR
jgi:2-polyprenyl-3-methyl-5-hydroxy-6-metoxy-1,4-benzoquinol methylase